MIELKKEILEVLMDNLLVLQIGKSIGFIFQMFSMVLVKIYKSFLKEFTVS